MSSRALNPGRLAFVCALALLTASLPAAAQDPPTEECFDATDRPQLTVIAGSSAARPFMAVIARLLAAAESPYTLVYQSLGSCVGVERVFSTDNAKRRISDIPAVGGGRANYAAYYRDDGTPVPCLLSEAGEVVDIGVSDVFASTCGFDTPAGVKITDFTGPIQPMTLVVPAASNQHTISAEAAYLALGLGGNNGKSAPWTDPSLFFIRSAGSGTQQMVAAAIGVPADKWWGVDRGGSSAIRDGLKLIVDAGPAANAVGILATSIADDERGNLRVLAFQAKDQSCAYWPDSSASSLDKANVRDGHYPIWGPLHFYVNTTNPNEAAAAVVGLVSVQRPDKILVDAIIERHLVPQCAMTVTRSDEMSALQSRAPTFRCGCYFDFVANGATDCNTCVGPGDCPAAAPACNFGYCEQQ